MDGKKRRVKEKLKVHRGFESSRLERELLATAYEQVLPNVRLVFSDGNSCGPVGRGARRVRSAQPMETERQIAMGGRYE